MQVLLSLRQWQKTLFKIQPSKIKLWQDFLSNTEDILHYLDQALT